MANPSSALTGNKLLLSVNGETLTGAKTLTLLDKVIQSLDPGGAGRTVTLPAAATADGYVFIIANTADAAEDITLNDGASPQTTWTASQGESIMAFSDGVVWRVIGGAIS